MIVNVDDLEVAKSVVTLLRKKKSSSVSNIGWTDSNQSLSLNRFNEFCMESTIQVEVSRREKQQQIAREQEMLRNISNDQEQPTSITKRTTKVNQSNDDEFEDDNDDVIKSQNQKKSIDQDLKDIFSDDVYLQHPIL